METATIKNRNYPTEIVTITCMNLNPHEKHSWREGFLWLTKKECGGVPADFYQKRKRAHRHNFKIMTPAHNNGSGVSFICWKTGCRVRISMYRHQMKEVLMENRPFESCYITYKETW